MNVDDEGSGNPTDFGSETPRRSRARRSRSTAATGRLALLVVCGCSLTLSCFAGWRFVALVTSESPLLRWAITAWVAVVPVAMAAQWTLAGITRTLVTAILWPIGLLGLAFLGERGRDRVEFQPPKEPAPTPSAQRATRPGDGRVYVNLDVFGSDGRTYSFPMLLDTGSTVTTLDAASLAELGVEVPSDAPVETTQTAGGPRSDVVLLLENVKVLGNDVGPLVVQRCADCRDDKGTPHRGLLGVNVTSRFIMEVELAAQRLNLQPRDPSFAISHDVAHWIATTEEGTRQNGVLTVSAIVNSVAPLAIKDLSIRVQC